MFDVIIFSLALWDGVLVAAKWISITTGIVLVVLAAAEIRNAK